MKDTTHTSITVSVIVIFIILFIIKSTANVPDFWVSNNIIPTKTIGTCLIDPTDKPEWNHRWTITNIEQYNGIMQYTVVNRHGIVGHIPIIIGNNQIECPELFKLNYVIYMNNEAKRYFEENNVPLSKVRNDVYIGLNEYINDLGVEYVFNPDSLSADGIYIISEDMPVPPVADTVLPLLNELSEDISSEKSNINLVIWLVPFSIEGMNFVGYGGGTRFNFSASILNPNIWVTKQSYVTQNSDGTFVYHNDDRFIQFYITHEGAGHPFGLGDYQINHSEHDDSRCYMSSVSADFGYGFCEQCQQRIKQKVEVLKPYV